MKTAPHDKKSGNSFMADEAHRKKILKGKLDYRTMPIHPAFYRDLTNKNKKRLVSNQPVYDISVTLLAEPAPPLSSLASRFTAARNRMSGDRMRCRSSVY